MADVNESGIVSPEPGPIDALFLDGSEAAKLLSRIDWSGHTMGPSETWPQSLRTSLSLCLSSRYPICILWGPERLYFYNDAYTPIVGGKHPGALGNNYPKVWPEIWDSDIRPILEEVEKTGKASWQDNILLVLQRFGFNEECYFRFSFVPIRDESNQVGGVFIPIIETTSQLVGDRRLQTLRDLAARTVQAKSLDAVFSVAAEVIGENPYDVPFALFYFTDTKGEQARLVKAAGIETDHAYAPAFIPLNGLGEDVWELRRVRESGTAQNVHPGAEALLPGGPWPEPAKSAMVLPISRPGVTDPTGFLVIGLSPRRPLDSDYQSFLSLVANQMGSAVSNVLAFDEEKKRAEALAEIDRAKTVFFSNVSHEFRTPLTLMLGPLDELIARSDQEVNPEHLELLKVSRRNGQRLLKLVNSLLDFSRIEANRIQAIYEPVDLSAYTADLTSAFRSAIEKAGLKLHVDCPRLPEPVYVDHGMWEKIVLNLVSNALKYTLQGEIGVSQRVERGDLVLTVKDTGIGIPAQEQSKIFDRFYRVEGAGGRTQEGTGIGLALVHELVKLHSGSVQVESTEGKGSTFTVRIPMGTSHLPGDRIGTARIASSTATGATPYVEEALRWIPGTSHHDPFPDTNGATVSQTSGTVVIADDNADMREYIKRLLISHYSVLEACDGEEALALAVREKPDLVVADVMMPKMDGFGLLKALRENSITRLIPVIMLSARAGEESRVEGLQAGADDYLIKPFSGRELVARVSGTIALHKTRREALKREEKLEQTYRAIGESIDYGVWLCDAEGRNIYASESFLKLVGLTQEECSNFGWGSVLHPEDAEATMQAWKECVATGKQWDREHRFRGLDGKWHPVLARGVPIRNEKGEITAWAGINLDISKLKSVENELRLADQRKNEFLATLAHELRNPLAPIRNGLHIMRIAHDDPAAIQQAREVMERQLQHMVRLIDDLMDLSRISRGKIDLRRQRHDIASILQNAVETSRPLIDFAQHTITLRTPTDPVYVNADLIRMSQVFSNLLNNAAKYTPSKGKIDVIVETDHDQAVVRIKDNGIGIPAEMIPSVFDMFVQINRSDGNLSTSGLGIGLSIVKRLVEMHGGEIQAKSDGLGLGSEFIVRLPLLQTVAKSETPIGTGPVRETPPPGRRILIADDHEDSLSSLATMLSILGNDVRTANDGMNALLTAEEFRPDLVFLDIGMPRLNGYDACRELRKKNWAGQVVIVALTGWGQDEDKNKSRSAGFDHHLVKPVELEALEKIIRKETAPPAS